MAVITETWFKPGQELDQVLQDVEDTTGYGFVRRDRRSGDGTSRGGGVAIVYRKNELQTHQLKIDSEFEIVATLSRRTGQRRKIITIGAYIPPAADADTSKRFLETISDSVRRFKAKYNAPYFIVAGDFNRRKIAQELREFSDIKLVRNGPTRCSVSLDLIFTNFPEYVKDSSILPALFNQAGTESDHKAVLVRTRIPRVPDYKVQSYYYTQQTPEGDAEFLKIIGQVDWTELEKMGDSSEMVDFLHGEFERAMSIAYKTIKTKRKSNQPQWINDYVLALIRRRRAVFRREGRSEEWKKLKKRTRSVIKHRKAQYNKQKREKMISADSKSFHKCVRAIISDEKTKTWSPRCMYPELSAQQVAEKCAEFFNGISSEYQPLSQHDIPRTFDSEELVVTTDMVEEQIKHGKKPKSRVSGDVFVNCIVQGLPILLKPITHIYNNIVQTGQWPKAWKVEHVTVIPKGTNPETPAMCRNISCTNFLSKVFERIVLRFARNQVTPSNNQFGGDKGCSTDHFLAEVWDQVTDHLEDSRAASILTSIDYSKAFNRLEHSACLRSFASKGASNQLIRLLASFLQERMMTVKVEEARSVPKAVNAGAPQGSVLGTYMFNVGTDSLEQGIDIQQNVNTYQLSQGDLSFLEMQPDRNYAESTPERIRFPTADLDDSPIAGDPTHQLVHFLPTARNIPPNLNSRRIEPAWRDRPVTVRKFVDDNLQAEKLSMKEVNQYQLHGCTYRNVRAVKSEMMFRHISAKAEQQGLKVNSDKTTLLSVSGAISYQARSHIYDINNTRIDCSEKLKALGFIFNRTGDVADQVENPVSYTHLTLPTTPYV